MIATSLRRESALELRLPEASGLPTPGNAAALEVSIDAEGRYAVNDQTLNATDAATLKTQLTILAGGRALPLILRADGRTPHQAVVTVLEVAGQLGLQQLTIATVNAPPATMDP
jgi:biopolymer transport protein ExbD